MFEWIPYIAVICVLYWATIGHKSKPGGYMDDFQSIIWSIAALLVLFLIIARRYEEHPVFHDIGWIKEPTHYEESATKE